MNSNIYIKPNINGKFVEELLNRIDAEYSPEIIPVRIEDYAEELNCYENVDKKVSIDGGKTHYGWVIYETDLLCEAERHAVWENEEEELIDITPREIPTEQVIFVSDNNFTYSGQFIDNIRVNITKNKVVDDFILICETESQLYASGERLDSMQIKLPPKAAELISKYQQLKIQFESYIKAGNNEKSKCFCDSQKFYKNCCQGQLRPMIKNDLLSIKK